MHVCRETQHDRVYLIVSSLLIPSLPLLLYTFCLFPSLFPTSSAYYLPPINSTQLFSFLLPLPVAASYVYKLFSSFEFSRFHLLSYAFSTGTLNLLSASRPPSNYPPNSRSIINISFYY